MNSRMVCFLFTLILSASSVNAAEFLGNVQLFYVNNSNLALLKLKQGNTANSPGCNPSDGWDFSFSSDTEFGKQWVSMLLASRMAEKEIMVGYTGNPNGRCQVKYIYFPAP